MVEVSAKAGVVNAMIAAKAVGAANVAARHECAPMVFPPGLVCLIDRAPSAVAGGDYDSVIAGLDPAIHPLRKNFFRSMMDARVKPAHDGEWIASSQVLLAMTKNSHSAS